MEQQNAYRSLQIKGTNSSKLAMDYLIFAIYEKSFKLDVVSGNIEKVGRLNIKIRIIFNGIKKHFIKNN